MRAAGLRGGAGGYVGGPEGTRGLPPFAPRQAPLRHRPPRSARDGAAPGTASARAGGGEERTQPPVAPSERAKWQENANSGKGSSQGVKCRLGSSEQRSLYSEIVTAVTGTLGSEEPTLGKLEGFASRESQLNAD